MKNENLSGLRRDSEREIVPIGKSDHSPQMKMSKMTLPEYKAFHNIPDECPESSLARFNAPNLSTPSPKPTKGCDTTPFENAFRRRYHQRTPSANTRQLDSKHFLFNTLNLGTPKTETLEPSSKRSQNTRDTIDSGVTSFTFYGKEKDLEGRVKNLADENKSLKDKVSGLSISLLEARKPLGYDEFYVKTLLQQKDYFEKEMKASHEILIQREAEHKNTVSQFETLATNLLEERNMWKEKFCALERIPLEKNCNNCADYSDLKRILEGKDKEIQELRQERQERETMAHNKLMSAAIEIERLKAVLEREEKIWQNRPEAIVEESQHHRLLQMEAKNLQRRRSTETLDFKNLNLSKVSENGRGYDDSTDFETFRRLDEDDRLSTSYKVTGNFGDEYGETRKFDLHHLMLMIEIDRLHSIIDELARLIELSSPNYVICRE